MMGGGGYLDPNYIIVHHRGYNFKHFFIVKISTCVFIYIPTKIFSNFLISSNIYHIVGHKVLSEINIKFVW